LRFQFVDSTSRIADSIMNTHNPLTRRSFLRNSIAAMATVAMMFIPLLLFSVVGLGVLLVLIVANLVDVVRQYRRRIPGARLTARLVVIFAALALHLLAYHFATIRAGLSSGDA
jgi:hypothetical protein